jgi:hypothetical protein
VLVLLKGGRRSEQEMVAWEHRSILTASQRLP